MVRKGFRTPKFREVRLTLGTLRGGRLRDEILKNRKLKDNVGEIAVGKIEGLWVKGWKG
jgi:hypothetical protein